MPDSPRTSPETDWIDPPKDWDERSSINPRYEGMTPGDAARALLRPRSPEAREALDRLRSQD